MLGNKLGGATGVVVIQRVLPSASGVPRTESTQRGAGTLLGVAYQDMSTYESELRPDGTIFGEGQGIYTGEGGEVATWVGQGVGTMLEGGGVSFRGAIYLYTTSEHCLRLNNVAGLFEYEVDAEGNFKYEIWEWK